MPVKKDISDLIFKSNTVHNFKYDYSKIIEVKNTKEKICIICPIHNEFWQSFSDHIHNKCGCPECGKEKSLSNRKLSINDFIEKSNKIHNFKYNYSQVNYINNHTKIEIICPSHGIFLQNPNSHLNGNGCRKCGNIIVKNKISSNTIFFIKSANIKHNFKYDYSQVNYINNRHLIEIICKDHGKFYQKPNSHLRGNGCPECGKLELIKKITSNTDEFIKKSILIHGNSFSYEKVVYKAAIQSVEIICKFHGSFFITPNQHLNGTGCQKCGLESRIKIRTKPLDRFILEAQLIHGSKYNYDKVVYINTMEKVIIACKTHGDFNQSPHNHLIGQGCKKCSKIISHKEERWLKSFNLNLQYQYDTGIKSKKGKNYKSDAYDCETNTIYEFYGDFWHGNPNRYSPLDLNKEVKKTFGELYNNTILRENKLKQAGYNLVSIWELDFDEIERTAKLNSKHIKKT